MKVIDQMDCEVDVPNQPQRIVSLVPSQTELLFDLGLDSQVIGLTKFCIHPKQAKRLSTVIGGTKKFNFEAIKRLNPDLIIGNKEENYKDGIDVLKKDYPVWMSDISNFDDALNMIEQMGMITSKTIEATDLISALRTQYKTVNVAEKTVAYLIWNKPIMVAGRGTFINDMLHRLGFTNTVLLDRYPEVSIAELREMNPDLVFLSSEPFPFRAQHLHQFKELLPNSNVMVVDGEMFSWYGSRMLKASGYFKELQTLIHQ